nr:immunoglobulin light chain junction region [Macaca mulatta]
CLQSKSSPLTF